jgi:hypothetical protein
MRYITIGIFTIYFFSSLTFQNINDKKKPLQINYSLIHTSSPILNGVWVSSDYVKAIQVNKSPLKSRDSLREIVSMVIDCTSKEDSLNILADWNNHEEINFTIFNKVGHKENSFKTGIEDYNDKTNYYELGYVIDGNDTILFIYHLNKENILLDKKPFIKISNQPVRDKDWGIRYIVNKTIMTGKYTMTDSHNNKTEITLNNDGSIIGYCKFKTYEVSTDFCGWAPWEYSDRICFNVLTDSVECYNFKIIKNSLKLYELTYDEDNMKVHIGSLKYELFKQ